MLFAHHIEVTFFGYHLEPEGVIEHMIAFSATGVVLLLAVYGGYTLVRNLIARWRRAENPAPRG